jgi:hypothetical protein
MISIHPQILEHNGKKRFAVLPYDQFHRLMEELADYEDLRLLRAAKAKEKNVRGIGLDELKTRLGIKSTTKRSPRQRSK